MLYSILSYFLITCICLWLGILIYSFIPQKGQRDRLVIHFLITGLIGFTAVGQWIVLFLPLTLVSPLLFLLICGVISFLRRKQLTDVLRKCRDELMDQGRLFYACLLCFLIMILVLNTGPTLMDDTDSYHIQMVKWIQEYGSVPGIANLHLRFGFNSSWFVSIALFSYPFHGLNIYTSLNGLLSVWLSYYLLETIFNSIKSNPAKSKGIVAAGFILFILCLLNWPMIRGSAMNANYDFISTCCIILLFMDLFTIQKEAPVEWLIWPAYMFTVRLMNFPLLILSLVYIYRFLKPFSARKLFLSFFAAGFIIIPFLIRNSILSGYPFFPFYQLDFFSFDWKADKMKLVEISRYIKYFNRVNPMFQPLSVTEKLGFPNWIVSWYTYLFRFDKLIIALAFLGYLILLIRVKKIKDHLLRIFLFVMVCQLISWFFLAPDPRFVYGSLLFGIFAAMTGLPPVKGSWSGMMKYTLILTSFFVLAYAVLKVVRDNDYRNFLAPHRIPVPAVKTIVVDHIQMHIPERILNNWNPRCYDIELPCLYRPDPRLEARGRNISDGFRLKYSDKDIFTGAEYKISE